MSATKVPPEPGQIWRERRTAYRLRTVEVYAVDDSFVYTRTLTGDSGFPPRRAVRNRVRLNLWHGSWARVPAGEAYQ